VGERGVVKRVGESIIQPFETEYDLVIWAIGDIGVSCVIVPLLWPILCCGSTLAASATRIGFSGLADMLDCEIWGFQLSRFTLPCCSLSRLENWQTFWKKSVYQIYYTVHLETIQTPWFKKNNNSVYQIYYTVHLESIQTPWLFEK
jgi:hypothetical protein